MTGRGGVGSGRGSIRAGRAGFAMKAAAGRQRKRADGPRWFNKWVQSPRWFYGFWISVAACLSTYGLSLALGQVRPGSGWGLGYGVAAVIVLGGVAFYGVRRRALRLRFLGGASYHLQLHVYGGALFLLLVLMHTTFSTPHGVLTGWLWFLSMWLIVGGFVGVVLQKWIPTLLNTGLTTEVHLSRIPELIAEIRSRAEEITLKGPEVLRDLYVQRLAPHMSGPQLRWGYYLNVTSMIQGESERFDRVRSLLAERDRARLDELEGLYRAKLEMDAHYTLQRTLRGWLYVHTPVALAVLGLLALHIVVVVYY